MNIFAPAKINLGLRVVGKRADGFHDIDTIFAELEGLADEIELRIRDDGEISWIVEHGAWNKPHDVIPDANEVSGSGISDTASTGIPASAGITMEAWKREDDLTYRAVQLLKNRYQVAASVDIHLTKNIPTGAGLGGGSSDAAAVLKGLNELWQLDLSLDELERLAAELGSDCAFFIRGGVQRGQGRGEVLSPVELPPDFPREVALVCPGIHVDTAAAYAQLSVIASEAIAERGDPNVSEVATSFAALSPRNDMVNDFEPVVFARHPELVRIRHELLAVGAETAAMSGSGSTIFGLFHERKDIPGVQWAQIVG